MLDLKKILLLVLATSMTSSWAVEPPKSFNNSRYYHLFQKSIVTDKPIPDQKVEEPSDLEDWVLVGSQKSTNSQSVTIMNSKDQSQRIVIPSKEATELGFAILELKQNRGNFMRTEAQLQKGKFRGWVKYDQKFLALKKPAPARAKPGKQSKARPSPSGVVRPKPPIPGLSNGGQKKTTNKPRARVRYVPKPKK